MLNGISDRQAFRWTASRSERGAASLEFGLVGMMFFLLLLGGMDFGRYFMTQHSLRTVVAEAARAAWVNGQTGCPALSSTQTSAVKALSPFLRSADLGLVVSAPAKTAGVSTVTITASYPFTFIVPAWSGLNGTISDATKISYPTPAGC